jgi:hypothetical protein
MARDETEGVAMSAGGLSNARYGTSWGSDRAESMVAILMTQRLWDSADPPNVYLDFWTSAYQAIDD